MRAFLRKWTPDPEKLRSNPWLRWLGPTVLAPQLWRFTRRGVALGVGVGVFFGLLIPIAQMPVSAVAAVLLRANIPTAVAGTLVSNPLTFGPLYYAAYRIGSAVLGEEAKPDLSAIGTPANSENGLRGWVADVAARLAALGRPLLLGLAILSTLMGVAAWLLVTIAWRLRVWWDWRRRARRGESAKET